MKKKNIIILILSGLILSACGNDSLDIDSAQSYVENSNTENFLGYNFPNQYIEEVDNVKFDTNIIISDDINENGLKEAKAVKHNIDSESIMNTFFNDIELSKSDEYDMDCYEDGDISIYVYDTSFMMTSDDAYYYSWVADLGNDINEKYKDKKEFSFATDDSAKEKIITDLNDANFTGDFEISTYYLDDTMLEEDEQILYNETLLDKDDLKDSWDEEDDAYYFAIHQKFQDLPVQYPDGDVFYEYCDGNAPITAIEREDGYVQLMIGNTFDFEICGEYLTLKDFSEIANTIAFKYGQLLTDAKYTVESAKLYYRPTPIDGLEEYDMVPIWQCDITDDTSGTTSIMYINAITGEEVAC